MREEIKIKGPCLVIIDDPDVMVRFATKKMPIRHKDLELDNAIYCKIYDSNLVVWGAYNPLTINPRMPNKVEVGLIK